MINITKQPYFSYDIALTKLSEPLMRMANVELSSFSRKSSDEKKIIITNKRGHLLDYYSREFYRYGLFEKPQKLHESGYHMWDHLPCDPHCIYAHSRRVHKIAHGLTVIKHTRDYTDIFLFATKPGNQQVNNFYLNKKELINQVTADFYKAMEPTIQSLDNHKIFVPYNTNFYPGPVASLSPRQLDCALLMTEGYTAQEIGKALFLSHRTVEDYIEVLKLKFEAKNRMHLIKLLQKYL
jgi:DNA-binding CsgD family transcriptional regulator